MTSEIRTNTLTSRAGLSTVTLTDSGPMFSGITTFVDNSGFNLGTGSSIFTPASNTLTFGTNNTEKVRVNTNGITVTGRIDPAADNTHDLGTNSVRFRSVYAHTLYGNGSNLTGISAGTALSGSTNNTVCTVTGANAIQGEANLTFTGKTLTTQTTSYPETTELTTEFKAGVANGNRYLNRYIKITNSYTGSAHGGIPIVWEANADGSNNKSYGSIGMFSDGAITFYNRGSGAAANVGSSLGMTEKLRIGNDGILVTYGTGAVNAEFNTSNSSGAYFKFDLSASGATTGYMGAGGQIVTGAAAADFGIRSQANMVFSSGGSTERLRITSGGQIQLPNNGQQLTWGASQQMKFYYENSEDRMYLQGDGAYGFAFRVNGGNRLEISKTTGDVTMQGSGGKNFQWDNSTADLYLTDSGSGASAKLKVGSGGDLQIYHDVGGANHIVCANNQELKLSANQFSFYDYTGVTQRLRIKPVEIDTYDSLGINVNGGNVNHTYDAVLYAGKTGNADWCIKAQTPGNDYGLISHTGSGAAFSLACYDGSNFRFRVRGDGVIFASNTTIQSISDVRLKENIVDANSQWDDVKALRFRNFNWKSDSGLGDGKTYLGLIAQEVEPISPNLVDLDAQSKEDIENGVPDPEHKSVKYSIVWMKAAKALQEAMTRIEKLEQENIALRARVTNLEGQ